MTELRMRKEFIEELYNNKEFMEFLDCTIKTEEKICSFINYELFYEEIITKIVNNLVDKSDYFHPDIYIKISKFVNVHIYFHYIPCDLQFMLLDYADVKKIFKKNKYEDYCYDYLKYKYYKQIKIDYKKEPTCSLSERGLNIIKNYEDKTRPLINEHICDDLVGIVFTYL